MRADAKRNYDNIVETARTVFRESGYGAPLDEIARRAGVGAGTVYRHFPTKDALYETVMLPWIEKVAVATREVSNQAGQPREVLLWWFEAYVDVISTYSGGPARITAALGDPNSPFFSKCEVLITANHKVIGHLGAAIRPGVDGLQMARLVGAVATVADQSALPVDAVRAMLEIIAGGMVR